MNTDIIALMPDENKLAEQENKALDLARAMVIKTPEDFTAADNFCVKLASLEKLIKSDFRESKEAAFAAHRAITAQEAAHLEKVVEPRKIVKGKMSVWREEQETARRAEEARIEAERKKQADDAALAQAQAAHDAGNPEVAEAILAAPIQVEPVVLETNIPKAQTVLRRVWKFRIVKESLIPRAYLAPDLVKLGQQARATHNSIPVPGIEFYEEAA